MAFDQRTLEVNSDLDSLNHQKQSEKDMPFEVVDHQSNSQSLFDDRPSLSSFASSSNCNGDGMSASNYDGIDQIEFFSNVITYLYKRIQQETRGSDA